MSFKKIIKFNLIGINLAGKMFYVHCYYESIKDLVKDVSNLHSAKIVFDNGSVYLKVNYYKKIKNFMIGTVKEAGIDIGINNLASVFVNDKTTPSLLIAGKPFKYYNAKFNRLLSKIQSSLSKEGVRWSTSKTGAKYPVEYSKRGKYLKKFIGFIYQKRNRYFYDQFHKTAKRILEYLKQNEVTCLYISRNLAELKNNGNCKLRKAVKQTFIEIPFMKLLSNIEYRAKEYGITVHVVDESWTSKASCISDNVVKVQNNPSLSNALNGKRDKRGLFRDTNLNKIFNADINAGANHVKVGNKESLEWLKDYLWKLSNPLKIKCDYDFCKLLQNSKPGKSVAVATEASQSVER